MIFTYQQQGFSYSFSYSSLRIIKINIYVFMTYQYYMFITNLSLPPYEKSRSGNNFGATNVQRYNKIATF